MDAADIKYYYNAFFAQQCSSCPNKPSGSNICTKYSLLADEMYSVMKSDKDAPQMTRSGGNFYETVCYYQKVYSKFSKGCPLKIKSMVDIVKQDNIKKYQDKEPAASTIPSTPSIPGSPPPFDKSWRN